MQKMAIVYASLISVFLLVGCGGSDNKKENAVSSSSLVSSSAPAISSSSAPAISSSSAPVSSSSSSSLISSAPSSSSISSASRSSSSSAVSSSSKASSVSSSASSSSEANVVLSGVAAVGAPIVNAPVVAKCANGSGFSLHVTTNAQGAFSGEVSASALPCALKVTGSNITLHSYALAAGVINITPLTDLIIANASTLDPAVWYASNNWQLLESVLLLAQTNFYAVMLANGYTMPQGVFNPFTTAFIIGDVWDKLLDQLQAAIALSNSLKSYADLLALLKDGNINALPKKETPPNNGSDGACSVVISANTSNALNPSIPLTQDCLATPYTGQVNFEINEGVAPNHRNLGIDFFAAATVGASIKLEDGYDYALHKGGAASYVDSAGVWNANSGTVTIVSITGDSYVLSLSNVHFVVLDATGTSKGSFTADGTITTKAPVATKGFSWTENGGSLTKTATQASFTNQYKTIYATGSASETIFEINLTGSMPGTYALNGSTNALAYIVNSAMFQATSGSVVITKNAALKMSGTFQATGSAAGGITTVSGTFTDVDVIP